MDTQNVQTAVRTSSPLANNILSVMSTEHRLNAAESRAELAEQRAMSLAKLVARYEEHTAQLQLRIGQLENALVGELTSLATEADSASTRLVELEAACDRWKARVEELEASPAAGHAAGGGAVAAGAVAPAHTCECTTKDGIIAELRSSLAAAQEDSARERDACMAALAAARTAEEQMQGYQAQLALTRRRAEQAEISLQATENELERLRAESAKTIALLVAEQAQSQVLRSKLLEAEAAAALPTGQSSGHETTALSLMTEKAGPGPQTDEPKGSEDRADDAQMGGALGEHRVAAQQMLQASLPMKASVLCRVSSRKRGTAPGESAPDLPLPAHYACETDDNAGLGISLGVEVTADGGMIWEQQLQHSEASRLIGEHRQAAVESVLNGHHSAVVLPLLALLSGPPEHSMSQARHMVTSYADSLLRGIQRRRSEMSLVEHTISMSVLAVDDEGALGLDVLAAAAAAGLTGGSGALATPLPIVWTRPRGEAESESSPALATSASLQVGFDSADQTGTVFDRALVHASNSRRHSEGEGTGAPCISAVICVLSVCHKVAQGAARQPAESHVSRLYLVFPTDPSAASAVQACLLITMVDQHTTSGTGLSTAQQLVSRREVERQAQRHALTGIIAPALQPSSWFLLLVPIVVTGEQGSTEYTLSGWAQTALQMSKRSFMEASPAVEQHQHSSLHSDVESTSTSALLKRWLDVDASESTLQHPGQTMRSQSRQKAGKDAEHSVRADLVARRTGSVKKSMPAVLDTDGGPMRRKSKAEGLERGARPSRADSSAAAAAHSTTRSTATPSSRVQPKTPGNDNDTIVPARRRLSRGQSTTNAMLEQDRDSLPSSAGASVAALALSRTRPNASGSRIPAPTSVSRRAAGPVSRGTDRVQSHAVSPRLPMLTAAGAADTHVSTSTRDEHAQRASALSSPSPMLAELDSLIAEEVAESMRLQKEMADLARPRLTGRDELSPTVHYEAAHAPAPLSTQLSGAPAAGSSPPRHVLRSSPVKTRLSAVLKPSTSHQATGIVSPGSPSSPMDPVPGMRALLSAALALIHQVGLTHANERESLAHDLDGLRTQLAIADSKGKGSLHAAAFASGIQCWLRDLSQSYGCAAFDEHMGFGLVSRMGLQGAEAIDYLDFVDGLESLASGDGHL